MLTKIGPNDFCLQEMMWKPGRPDVRLDAPPGLVCIITFPSLVAYSPALLTTGRGLIVFLMSPGIAPGCKNNPVTKE